MTLQAQKSARQYYDDELVDLHYHSIWGGKTICIGTYADNQDDIGAASLRTVERLAQLAGPPTSFSHVLDLGAGYGGSARYLAQTFGCRVTCLNLSPVQNARNRKLCQDESLSHLVDIIEGSFDNVPMADHCFDVIWSQDALLHSGDRSKVLDEIDRLLTKSSGVVVLTDIVQRADVADSELFRTYMQRLPVQQLATMEWYQSQMKDRGFKNIEFLDRTRDLAMHYQCVLQSIEQNRADFIAQSQDRKRAESYIESSKKPLETAAELAEKGDLRWVWMIFCR